MDERKCAAADCKNKYQPVREMQRYCSLRCKNREAGRRLVKRSQRIVGRDRAVGSIPTVRSLATPGHASPARDASRKASRPITVKSEESEPENPLADLLDNLFDKEGIVDVPEDDETVDPWTGEVRK